MTISVEKIAVAAIHLPNPTQIWVGIHRVGSVIGLSDTGIGVGTQRTASVYGVSSIGLGVQSLRVAMVYNMLLNRPIPRAQVIQ